MRRPRILVDVDGPLTRGFFVVACQFLRDEGVPAHPDRIDRWDIFEAFNASPEVETWVRDRLCVAGIASAFKPRTGAGKMLAELRTWADVYAVTAPLDGSETWTFDRERWLRDRLGFSAEKVIHARDKRLIGGDVFIDDKVEHLVAWGAEHPEGLAILWAEPHNASSDWAGPRVADYAELKDILNNWRKV